MRPPSSSPRTSVFMRSREGRIEVLFVEIVSPSRSEDESGDPKVRRGAGTTPGENTLPVVFLGGAVVVLSSMAEEEEPVQEVVVDFFVSKVTNSPGAP